MISRVLRSRLFLGVIIIIFIISSFELINEIGRRYKVSSEINRQQKTIDQLKQQNGDLRQLIQYLNTDQFIEEEARKKLGLSKSGESVVVFTSSSTEPQIAAAAGETNPQLWWNYFFDD